MSVDLYDISHHNTLSDNWRSVADIPIVHKVNEGKAIDRRFGERIPIISQRTLIFGGYTVLVVSKSTIRQQVEQYARLMEPWWRDGAFTQLDVEPWPGYSRPVNCDEIEEAQAVHDELFGPGRCTVYINPNQMPGTFQQWFQRNRGRPLWLPNYSAGGPLQAHRWGAVIHQFTSLYPAPGFERPIDANRVLDWATLETVCNLNHPTPPEPPPRPQPETDDLMILIKDTVLDAVFTQDGDPVSGEALSAYTAQNVPLIEQNHPEWRAATLAKLGGQAAFDYGVRAAKRGTA